MFEILSNCKLSFAIIACDDSFAKDDFTNKEDNWVRGIQYSLDANIDSSSNSSSSCRMSQTEYFVVRSIKRLLGLINELSLFDGKMREKKGEKQWNKVHYQAKYLTLIRSNYLQWGDVNDMLSCFFLFGVRVFFFPVRKYARVSHAKNILIHRANAKTHLCQDDI